MQSLMVGLPQSGHGGNWNWAALVPPPARRSEVEYIGQFWQLSVSSLLHRLHKHLRTNPEEQGIRDGLLRGKGRGITHAPNECTDSAGRCVGARVVQRGDVS